VANVTDFATEAGIAFQLQDDVLGIIGDEQTLGKPIGSDLREGKRTLIVTKAWSRADEDGKSQISAVLGNPRANVEQIAAAKAVLVDTGAVDEVRDMAQNYMGSAMIHLHKIPANIWRDRMSELAERMIARKK
jgi:geranylgeranyl diphosphate synthase type I